MSTPDRNQMIRVGDSLAHMQLIYAFFLVSGLALTPFLGPYASPNLKAGIGMVYLAPWLYFQMCVYRCASGTGRSGLGWVLLCLLGQLLALMWLASTTRNWLEAQGARVHMFGFGYDLPAGLPASNAAHTAPVPMSLRLSNIFVLGGLLFVAAGLGSVAAWLAPGTSTVLSSLLSLVLIGLTGIAAGIACQAVTRNLADYAEIRSTDSAACQRLLEPLRQNSYRLGMAIAGGGATLSALLSGAFFPLLVATTTVGFLLTVAIGSGRVSDQ